MSDLQRQLDPTDVQALEALMEAIGEDIRVGIPGIVSKVESTNPPRVTVLPAVGRYGVTSADPGIPGVRWGTMASGGATVALPVSVNDPCWLMVADRELDGWMAKDGASSVRAQIPRTHDLADVVAIPMDIGSLPTGAAGNLWLGYAGNYLKMVTGGASELDFTTLKIGASAFNYATKGTALDSQLATLLSAINAYVILVGAAMQAMGLSWIDVAPLLGGPAVGRATASAAACTAAGAAPAALVTSAITLFNAAPATALRTSTKVEVE